MDAKSTAAEARFDLGPGMLVSPNVRLEQLIGQGGGGSVFTAMHLALGMRVAVKFLLHSAHDDESMARFTREAMLAAQIKSPHAVQIFDYGMAACGTPFIVMELLDGEDLSAKLRREGALSAGEAATIVRQVCKALSRAHALGFVHRDIKPGNIFLLDSEDEIFVKVLDFGSAKKPGETSFVETTRDTVIGTPQYMSPEQAVSSRTVDHRCDLWATAIVAYICLTGRRPFGRRQRGTLCAALNGAALRPASEFRPDLPAEIDGFFARAFDRDLNRRFGSARELADAFANALESREREPETRRQPLAPEPVATELVLGSTLVMYSKEVIPRAAEPVPESAPNPPSPPQFRGPRLAAVFAIATLTLGVLVLFTAGLGAMLYVHRRPPAVVAGFRLPVAPVMEADPSEATASLPEPASTAEQAKPSERPSSPRRVDPPVKDVNTVNPQSLQPAPNQYGF